MKKISNILKYKWYQRKRALLQQNKRREYKDWRRNRNRAEQGIPKLTLKHHHQFENARWQYDKILVAPTEFSFIHNTEETIRFIQKLDEIYNEKKKVFINLENIVQIDYSAIVVLLSLMVRFKTSNIRFNGNFPKNYEASNLLINSGFFDNLDEKYKPADKYVVPKFRSQVIHTNASKIVDAALGNEIIKYASDKIWGEPRRCQGVQRVFLELMQNTHNHAEISKEGQKHWWLAVNYSEQDKKVCFAFVDFGVGVFKSLDSKPTDSKWANWRQKLSKIFTWENNIDILRYILEGEFHRTVTNEYYRGKGLPGIAEVQKRNGITNLCIITNDAYCSFGEQIYRKLNTSFSGTFIYWELNETNANCKAN